MENGEDPLLVKYLISSFEFEKLKYFEAKCAELSKEIEKLKLEKLQTGKGECVVIPPNHDSIETPVMKKLQTSEPLINYSVPLQKSDENDEFDESALLHLVPFDHKASALALLKKLDDHVAELTWNSSGTVYLNQISIPNSNFFLIFPHLFQHSLPKKRICGLLEVRNKLISMGLSKYFLLNPIKESLMSTEISDDPKTKLNEESNDLTGGSSAAHNVVEEKDLAKDSKMPNNWWYIGKRSIFYV